MSWTSTYNKSQQIKAPSGEYEATITGWHNPNKGKLFVFLDTGRGVTMLQLPYNGEYIDEHWDSPVGQLVIDSFHGHKKGDIDIVANVQNYPDFCFDDLIGCKLSVEVEMVIKNDDIYSNVVAFDRI